MIPKLKPTFVAGALGIALMMSAVPSMAQQTSTTDAKKSPAAAGAIAPGAVAAITRMTDYLRTLKAYSVRAETTTDEVLLSGPKVQFGGTIDLTVRDPDGVHIVARRDDRDDQRFFYNGKLLSVWFEAKRNWAAITTPPTIAETLELVEQQYEVNFPLGDLLLLATRKGLLNDVRAGIVVGTGKVAGVECDHLGFHQDGVDWQIWIEKGDRPLPRKILITTLSEPSQPQHSEILTWDLSPKIDPAMFTFVPPEGANRITIAQQKAVRQAKAAAAAKDAK